MSPQPADEAQRPLTALRTAALRLLAPWLLAAACLVAPGLSAEQAAGGAAQPSPELTPRQVLAVQLQALQHNNRPDRDAGIELAWTFAHPDNRTVTGPLPRFVAMLHTPPYADLLGHRSHSVESAVDGADEQGFVVEVITADGRVVTFGWLLQRSSDLNCDGCWLTGGVVAGRAEPSI